MNQELIYDIERGFTVGEELITGLYKGERVLTFAGVEMKKEGNRVNGLFLDESTALKFLFEAFCEYAKGKENFTLHWRAKPKIRTIVLIDKNGLEPEEKQFKYGWMRLILTKE